MAIATSLGRPRYDLQRERHNDGNEVAIGVGVDGSGDDDNNNNNNNNAVVNCSPCACEPLRHFVGALGLATWQTDDDAAAQRAERDCPRSCLTVG